MLLSYLNQKIQQTKRYYYRFGFRKTFFKVIKSILSGMHKRDVFIMNKKDLTEEMKFSFRYKLKVQKIEESHLDALRKFNEKYDVSTGATPIAKINDFLESNYHGFMASLKGDIIGYLWWVDNTTRTGRNHPGLILFKGELEDDCVYWFDFFVAPEYRGNNNATEFLYKVCLAFRKLGYKQAFGVLILSVISARWLYKLLGFKDVKRFVIHKFFRFILVVNKTIFLKTNKRYLYYPSSYRAVYPFWKSKLLNR